MGTQEDLVAAAEAANSYVMEAAIQPQNQRRSAIEVASRAVARIVRAPMRYATRFSPPTSGTKAGEGDITRDSTELEVYNWYCEALHGYQLGEWQTQPWKRRFLQNKMNGAALLAIRSDRELRDVFGVELKGVRARLLRDIEHERANQTSADSTTTMDVWLRQFCYILFATLAIGFMLQELSQILIPVILSFALTAFMLPIVDALNKRPSRCCFSTYPAYCIDGYEKLMPHNLVQGENRRGCCAKLLRSFLLCIIPRWLATIIAVCVVFAVVAAVVLIIATSVQDGLDNVGNYTEKVEFMINASTEYMMEMGLNQTDIDRLYGQVPAAAIAVSGASTAASAWMDFIIILLFSTYLVIETGGVRQAPGYINARVYRKFLMPFNPNQPPGQRRQRLTKEHRVLKKNIQKKLRDNYDIFATAFDEFDVHGDGLLSPDEFRLGLTRFVKGFFTIDEINALRDALIRLHEAYRVEKQSSIRVRIQKSLSSYMVMKISFSAITGIAMAMILLVFDADLWAMYGVISFVLNFIPTLGGMVACLLTLPILVIDPDIDFYKGLLCFAMVVGFHLLVAAVLEPVTFGRQYRVHPVAVLISLMLWVSLWGFVGAFLSTPFLIIVAITLEGQPHPLAKGLFRAIRGNVAGELPGTTKAITQRPKSRAAPTATGTEKSDKPGRLLSAIADVGQDNDEGHTTNSDSGEDLDHVASTEQRSSHFPQQHKIGQSDLFPVTPSPRANDHVVGEMQVTTTVCTIQSVVHPSRRLQTRITLSDTVGSLCAKLSPAMQMEVDESMRLQAQERVEVATAKVEDARQALTDASERLVELEESHPTEAAQLGDTLSSESSAANPDDPDQLQAASESANGAEKTVETAVSRDAAASNKEAKKEAKNKAKVEKKKGKSSREIEKAMMAIQQAGDELDEVVQEAKETEVRARHTGCLVFRGAMLDAKAGVPETGLLSATTDEILWLCQNRREKEELVLDRWCFDALPSDESDDTEDNGDNTNWEVVILTKSAPRELYMPAKRYRVEAVLSGADEWVHLEVSSLDDGSILGVRRFWMEFFRPRWLDQEDRSQIDMRRVFEGLSKDPPKLVDFARTNLSVREPRFWQLSSSPLQDDASTLFLDSSGAWPLTNQRWIIQFGSDAQATDSRWCLVEVRKATRGGSYQHVSAPLPIVAIEPLPSNTAEGDNDEIRITVRHPLDLCSAAPRAYALSKFAWAYYDSSDSRLAEKFSRLCPTPNEREMLNELEQSVQSMRILDDSTVTGAENADDGYDHAGSPDKQLTFEQHRVAAELTFGRSRLDAKQRQFREFLETNLHVSEQDHWLWPERARSGSNSSTPRAAR